MGQCGITSRILNLGTSLRWVVASRPGRFTLGVRSSGTRWMYLRAGLDAAMTKWKNPYLSRELNPGRPSRSFVIILQWLIDELGRMCKEELEFCPNICLEELRSQNWPWGLLNVTVELWSIYAADFSCGVWRPTVQLCLKSLCFSRTFCSCLILHLHFSFAFTLSK
jgi:hypothetical protein